MPSPLEVPRLVLPPGVNRFALRSPDAAVRVSEGRYQLRTFCIESLSLEVVGGAKFVD